MNIIQTISLLALLSAAIPALAAEPAPPAAPPTMFNFDFGSGPVAPGYVAVTPDTIYTTERGYGFEDLTGIQAVDRDGPDALHRDFCTSDKPFLFSVKLPEGNYNVTAILGDQKDASNTTVKAESRRLMLENVTTTAGNFATHTFTINIRTPEIAGGGRVRLKGDEGTYRDWDDKLTLEFNGTQPKVCALQIVPATDAITVYLAGDSTVTDQPEEPWNAWGQMLPRFFKPGLSIANHAHSGEALYSFRGEKRLDKILSTIKGGDYLFIQFGHNDQKDKSAGSGPFTSYKANLKQFITAARDKAAHPVIVTPMERRRFQGNTPVPTLSDYAEAARQVGTEENVPVIDLNAMSLKFYAALGPQNSTKAFVHYPANTFPGQTQALKDDTHFNNYGGYELAKCIVEGIKTKVPDLAKGLLGDTAPFDPAQPDSVESVVIPPSPFHAAEKPAGS